MSIDLAVAAELRKLARELGTDESVLESFGDLTAAQVAELRAAVHHKLDSAYRPAFKAIERAARLLPPSLSVRIATRFFSPMLIGNVATELSPERAERMLPLIDVEFMADCVPYLDPIRARPVVAGLPFDTMLPTTRAVIARRDHVTLGRLLGALPESMIEDVVPLVSDGRDLLLIGFHTEVPSVLTPIVAAMTDQQLRAMTEAAVEHDLVGEAIVVAGHLDGEQLGRLRALAPDELLTELDDS